MRPAITERIIDLGDTRLIATSDGGRAEVRVLVDGVPIWREAVWENEVVSQLCSSRYGIREDHTLALRPVLREGEVLRETVDGRVFIESAKGGVQ